MWQEKRTEYCCDSLKEAEADVYRRCGMRISPVFSAPKINWIKDNKPEIYSSTYKFIGIQDLLLNALTGNFVTDASLASRTCLLNLQSKQWDRELMQIFDIEEDKLCSIIEPGSSAGGLSAEAAGLSGLRQSIPVISAGGDQQCAALGQGMFDSSTVVANTGTGSYLIGLTAEPVFDPDMRLSCNVSAVKNSFIIEASVLTTGSIYRWFSENFYDGSKNFELLNSDVEQTPAGANGVLLLPYFKDAGSPMWEPSATGSFHGLTLATSKADMCKAVIESIAFELADNLNLFSDFIPDIRTISTAGGMTSFSLFNQIQADAANRKVIRYQSDEATSLGAWISAAYGLGHFPDYKTAFQSAVDEKRCRVFDPISSNTEIYSGLIKKRQKLLKIIKNSNLYDILTD